MIKFPVDKKYQVPLIVVFCVLIAAGLIAMIVKDIRERFHRLDKQKAAVEDKMSGLLEIQRGEQAINVEYDRFASYLMASVKDSRAVIEDLLREVERVAKVAGISIINLGPQAVPDDPKRKKIYRADLRMEGAPEKVVEFMRQVEQSPVLIQIVKTSLSVKDETASVLKGELTIELAVD